jgi:1,4-alpha-glucan branching enzyme
VDGRWISDPFNRQREKDGSGGYNSILFCSNHTFYLAGHQNAKSVVVTGNFYNWRQQGLKMKKTAGGWTLPVYLRDGMYAYKFLVDRQWTTDPANPDIRKDSGGNDNSFLGIGESYLFKLDGYKEADRVILSGSFNRWNDGELLMTKTGKGWQLPYFISAGNYEYKFIVDGRWIKDPANPFSSGNGDQENSFIALKANHIFELKQFPDAKNVVVTGSFTGWNHNGYKMVKTKDKWILPIYLKPGKYTYKFIVDDKWIIDPANNLYEQNEYDTNNSVLWIEP